MNAYDTAEVEGTELTDRDVRALTEYLTVLPVAPGMFEVVSQSGKSYTVDNRTDTCECPDNEYRDIRCKHLRRVDFATGGRDVPTWIADDVAGDLGEHVDATPRKAVADGGQVQRKPDVEVTRHVEPPEQGGERYLRCEGCGTELLESLGGEDNLLHRDGCPVEEGR